MKEMQERKLSLLLHNVRSAHNVGSIFRTADSAGVDHIYLTGYTPRPYDGSKPYTTKPERGIIKIALGAQESVSWSGHETAKEVIDDLKTGGVEVVALEQTDDSIDYKDFDPIFPMVLVLGNEPKGIDEELLALCGRTVELPMYGTKQSLNVSVAAGIALYEIIHYHKK